MKPSNQLFVLLLMCGFATMAGCDDENQTGKTYKGIFFQRTGGGDKEFFVHPDPENNLLFRVSRYSFRDTSYSFVTPGDSVASLLDTVQSVLSGRIEVSGTPEQSQNPTGTWVKIYAVSQNGSLTEITNQKTYDSLLPLEEIVERAR
jgi:hypothetical protein